MSLRTYKKQSLKEMCQKLGLSDEGLKNDLEDRLQEYLDQNNLYIEDVPELQDLFLDLPVSPSTARKAVRKSIALVSGDDSDFDFKAKTSEMLKPVSQRLSSAAHDIDISPAKVAQWATDTKNQYLESSKYLPTLITKGPRAAAKEVQSQMSQVSSIAALSVIIEGMFMTKALVPLKYEYRLGGISVITLPDILVFLSVGEYWKPILTWLSFQLVPLFFSMMINLRSSHVIKKSRKAAPPQYAYDPVTFAIAKLLMVYLAFSTSLSSFAFKEVALVQKIVGGETFIIGTAITLIYALYEAAL